MALFWAPGYASVKSDGLSVVISDNSAQSLGFLANTLILAI